MKTGAEIVLAELEARGVETLAGVPGGACLPLYDALYRSRVRHVLARHEQGAAFIAQGMGRVTGRAGVCFATSGPGVANLVTALADARLDSVPLVAITGQVPTHLVGTDAFQEVDACAMCAPVTKQTFFVERAEDVAPTVRAAFEEAEGGRKGPVLIDLPKDVQQSKADWSPLRRGEPPTQRLSEPEKAACRDAVRTLAEMIDGAERPILLVGGGAAAAGAGASLVEIARRTDVPVAMTLHGLGVFPDDDPLCLGMAGMHGAPFTNWVLDEADLVVAVGARFDDRVTGDPKTFCPRARIVHVDIDPREIGKILPAALGIVGDAAVVARELAVHVRPRRRPRWRARIDELRRRGPMPTEGPARFAHLTISAIDAALPRDAIVTTDVGQHQMWVAQWMSVTRPRRLLTSGGFGTMGFGLPAAIGAALAAPDRRVVCVTGDGSMLMNVQELATLRELDLDVTVVVLDNQRLGLVRQQQALFFDRRFSGCAPSYTPSFVEVARAFGLAGRRIEPGDEQAMKRALGAPGPRLLEVPIPADELVLPMVPPGAANSEMIGAPGSPVRAVGSERSEQLQPSARGLA